MNNAFELRVIDREGILFLVQELREFEQDKAIKAGLRRGARRIVTAGKRNLRARMKKPQGVKGNLLKSFKVKVKRKKLGALAGFDYMGAHSRWVDLGTKARRDRGIMPGNKFWSDTKESEEQNALNEVYKGVERAVQRINERRRG